MKREQQNNTTINIEVDGFKGEAQWYPDNQAYYGRVINLEDPAGIRLDEISFQGVNAKALVLDLRQQIEFYQQVCTELGKLPVPPKI